MHINWVFIAVLSLLTWEMIRGYRRGLLRTVFSLISWAITLVFVMWASPYIEDYLLEHTSLYENIQTRCAEKIRDAAEQGVQKPLGEHSQYGNLAELGINLPDGVLDSIRKTTGEAAFEFLEGNGIYEELAKGMAGFVIQGISFFVAMAAAWILLYVLSKAIGIVAKIPVIHGVNKILGIFAGALYAVVLVWIAFYLIALTSAGEWGREMIAYIYQNPVLQFLYENNLVITILLNHP